MKTKIHRYSYGPITTLQIEMTRYGYPSSVFAVFNDDKHLDLTYVPTWRQCFAFLRGGEERLDIERPFRHHVTIPWTDMTYNDWINLCLAYRKEMEEEQIILKEAKQKE